MSKKELPNFLFGTNEKWGPFEIITDEKKMFEIINDLKKIEESYHDINIDDCSYYIRLDRDEYLLARENGRSIKSTRIYKAIECKDPENGYNMIELVE